VADKGRISWDIKQLSRIKTWQLFVILILLCFVAATFLRLNNIGMNQRRDAVHAADKAGNTVQIISALSNLQQYVSAHMNTDLGNGVFLNYSYSRAYESLNKQAATSEDPNGNIYEKASAYCDPQFPYYTWAYQQCIVQQLQKYPGSNTLANPDTTLPPSLYTHNYASPLWSPDFAGFSVLACFIVAFIIVARVITLAILRVLLRIRYRSI